MADKKKSKSAEKKKGVEPFDGEEDIVEDDDEVEDEDDEEVEDEDSDDDESDDDDEDDDDDDEDDDDEEDKGGITDLGFAPFIVSDEQEWAIKDIIANADAGDTIYLYAPPELDDDDDPVSPAKWYKLVPVAIGEVLAATVEG